MRRAAAVAVAARGQMVPVHVLLLHGLPADRSDWRQVAERLAAAGATPLVPDRPGWGSAQSPARGIAGNVDAALGVLDEAGAERAVVAGHSWGTLVALALALRAPGRVAAVALVSPFGPGSIDLRARAFAAPLLAPLLVSVHLTVGGLAQLAPPTRWWISRRFGFTEQALRDRGRRWLTAAARRSFLLEQRAAVAELDSLLAAAPALEPPALVLVGERDLTTGAEPARALARELPNARLTVVPRVGHYLPLSRPEIVACELERLLP